MNTRATDEYAGTGDAREPVIVTAHEGAVEWLRRKGITAAVYEQATPSLVRDRVVYGTAFIPLHVAVAARCVYAIYFAAVPPGLRQKKSLSADEMEQCGAYLRCFRVFEEEAVSDER